MLQLLVILISRFELFFFFKKKRNEPKKMVFLFIIKATSKIANEQLMISSIESGAVDHLVFPMTSLTLKSLWLVFFIHSFIHFFSFLFFFFFSSFSFFPRSYPLFNHSTTIRMHRKNKKFVH